MKKTNLIKIIPQDDNFDPVSVRFKGIGFGRIVLPQKEVTRSGRLIISGKTFLKHDNSILKKLMYQFKIQTMLSLAPPQMIQVTINIAIPGDFKIF